MGDICIIYIICYKSRYYLSAYGRICRQQCRSSCSVGMGCLMMTENSRRSRNGHESMSTGDGGGGGGGAEETTAVATDSRRPGRGSYVVAPPGTVAMPRPHASPHVIFLSYPVGSSGRGSCTISWRVEKHVNILPLLVVNRTIMVWCYGFGRIVDTTVKKKIYVIRVDSWRISGVWALKNTIFSVFWTLYVISAILGSSKFEFVIE